MPFHLELCTANGIVLLSCANKTFSGPILSEVKPPAPSGSHADEAIRANGPVPHSKLHLEILCWRSVTKETPLAVVLIAKPRSVKAFETAESGSEWLKKNDPKVTTLPSSLEERHTSTSTDNRVGYCHYSGVLSLQ